MSAVPMTTGTTSFPKRDSLSGAYFWVLAFLVVYCARPEDWIPGLSLIPLAKITGLFAILAFILSIGKGGQRYPRELTFLFLFFGQLCLTVPFSAWRGGAFWTVVRFSKGIFIIAVMMLVVNSLYHLRNLIFVQTGSAALIAVATVIKGRNQPNGRLMGVLGGIYSNPNDLAFAIVLSMPFCFAFMLRTKSFFRKALWAGAMLVMTYALYRTGSRAGLLALVISGAVILWEFGVKGGRKKLLVFSSLVAVLFLFLFGGTAIKRFQAMVNPAPTSRAMEDARGSSTERWELLRKSIALTLENPLLGIGPGNFEVLSGMWHVTHNTYTQVSSEGGLPAFIFYMLILLCAFQNVRRSRGLVQGREEETLYVGALQASLVGYLVGSFFSSEAYLYFPYFLVAYTTGLYTLAKSYSGKELEPERVARPRIPYIGSWKREHKSQPTSIVS